MKKSSFKSKNVNISSVGRDGISRRQFLRGTGVMLSLPFLESLGGFAHAATPSGGPAVPRRMLAICNNLGLLGRHFYPEGEGADYVASPYLKLLEKHRKNFTVFNGVSHPDVDGGHPADNCFLTAAPHPGRGGFRNTISLDQKMAEHVGHLTRFPSLTLGVNARKGAASLSWTPNGVLIPCENSAAAVFKQLFLNGSESEKDLRIHRLRQGGSIMDAVAGQAKRMQQKLGNRDRERLDQYYTGVRDLENRLVKSEEWEHKPKPKASVPMPMDPNDPSAFMEKIKVMYEMSKLALESDSTRLVTLMLDGMGAPALTIDGEKTSDGYHNLSHHGQRKEKLRQLRGIDEAHMRLFSDLLSSLESVKEDDDSLLDRTMVLYGSNLGDANAHSTVNLPTLFAGGGFKHGKYVTFDTEHNYPLPNLFVSMMQRMGIEEDKFASSTGTMSGLEMI